MSSARELVARRELLWNLTLRELRGRYKRSILGWAWSLLNPIAFMVIYTFAFSIILDQNPQPGDPSGLSSYALFLMCGLLPWSFFNVSVSTSMGAVVANGSLVRKVAFPREHLVVSTIIAGLFTLAIELAVLSVALAFAGNVVLPWIPVILLVMLLLAVFSAGLSLALAAGNVFFRDLTYLWSIVVQGWFFATPIVYDQALATNRLADKPILLKAYNNLPLTVVVRMFRNLMFDLRMPRLLDFGVLTGYALAAVLVGWWIFDRVEGRFAEEL